MLETDNYYKKQKLKVDTWKMSVTSNVKKCHKLCSLTALWLNCQK